MRIAILFAFIIPLSFSLADQPQRYLVSSSGKVIPLQNGEDPSKVIQSVNCDDGFTFGPEPYGPPEGRVLLHPRDVAAQWYVVPITGRIDTLYFLVASLGGVIHDSTVYIRFRESNIDLNNGPGHAPYPAPCTPWGYYTSTADPDKHIAGFREDATDTTWHSTVSGTTPSFPPMKPIITGITVYPMRVQPNTINVFSISDVTELNVVKGQAFFVAMRWNPSPLFHFPPDSEATIGLRYSTNGTPYPSRAWKFFEHPPNFGFSCGGDSVPGWYARTASGDTLSTMMYNWWFLMRVTVNTPPLIQYAPLFNTTITSPREVNVQITDCNVAHPESAGVASAEILFSVNGGPTMSAPLSLQSGDTWSGFIPGQPVGSKISYRIRATDIQGVSDSTVSLSYQVVGIHSESYRCDTGYTCTSTPIHSTGIAIDTSEWFLPPGVGTSAHKGDDGTAGPFSLGGPFVFYGDTVYYAWIGVDGAKIGRAHV